MFRGVWFDLRVAVRLLRRSPRSTAIAVAILALAIGANTAMFSAVNFVILRPLPFADAGRLLRLRDSVKGADGALHAFNMSSRDVAALDRATAVFDGVVAFSPDSLTMPGRDGAERVSVVYQTADMSRTLRVTPALGRSFSAEEERRGLAAAVALVSDAFWKVHLGGSSSVLGSPLLLGGRSVAVIGVMPPHYAFPYEAEVWLPFAVDPADQSRDFAVFVHMRPGVSRVDVRTALDNVAADIRREYPATLPSYAIEIMTIHENLVGTQDAPLRALTEIVSLLLVIACVNVATLLLARSVIRRHEFAVRAALGASQARQIRQLLIESGVLALAGCAGGLLVAAWLAPITGSLVPTVFREQLGLTIPRTDWRVMFFAVAASMLSAIVAGILPAFGSWRASPRASLVEGGRTMSGGGGRHLLGVLIVAETALTMVLVAGAGLVIRNFVELLRVPLGFEPRGLLTTTVVPAENAYQPGPARAALVRRLVEEVRSEPGVRAAAVTTVNPLGDGTWGAAVVTEEMAARQPGASANVNHRLITPGLFETMKIGLRRGRTFTNDDRAGSQPVAIVSERMAKRLWPGEDALGKRVRIARPGTPWVTVVGIADDVDDAHDPGVPVETWYLPYDQNAASSAAAKIYVMTRSDGDALSLVGAVRRAIGRVDKTLAPYAPAAMDHYYAGTISRERLGALFMFGFGGFGLLLAGLGVYGVMAFSVAQRTGEIGIRMALGAQTADILPLVLQRSLALVGAGLAVGLAASAALNRALSSVLTEVGRLDPVVLAIAGALILATTIAAALGPAISAASIDPLAALRRAAD